MLPEWTVVGFSGHRSIADLKVTAESISAALDALVAKRSPIVAISSLARGSDTLFVREIASRKIPFVLILSFPTARLQKDFEPESWQQVAPLITQAFHVEEVPGSESDDEAYMETGVRIVDLADIVIAVWDGNPSAGLGGTGDVVAYSRALSKPLQWLNPATGDVVIEQLEHLPVTGTSVRWNGDPYQTVEKHFHDLDENASLRAPRVRHLIQLMVLLHLTASAAGLIALALNITGLPGYGIALLEVAVLGTAFVLITMQHRKHLEWTKARIEAEVCRSFLATWPMRARITRYPKLSIPGFERLMRNLHLLQQMDRTPAPPLETASNEYLGSRIQDQIEYFRRRSKEAQRAYRRLRGLAMTSTAAAGLLAAGHFALTLVHVESPLLPLAELMSLVLPLVSAALFSLILTQEHSRRASRYTEMVRMLEEAARQLKAVRTWNGLTRIATDTEEQLLNEAVEWHSFRRFASEPH